MARLQEWLKSKSFQGLLFLHLQGFNKIMSRTQKVLTLFSKRYCGLCEEAKEQLLNLQQRIPFELREIDIEKDNKWIRYTFDIPVLHIGDKIVMKHKIDLHELEKILN